MLISSNNAFTGTSRLFLTEYLGTMAREQCVCVCVHTRVCRVGGHSWLSALQSPLGFVFHPCSECGCVGPEFRLKEGPRDWTERVL